MTEQTSDIPETRSDSAFDARKARAAARDPRRPGERCGAEPGLYVPRVDPSRCEAKAECVSVCPYRVFEIGTIDPDRYRELPMLARLKVWAHRKQTAHTPRADACRACGLCVVACPERAIELVRASQR